MNSHVCKTVPIEYRRLSRTVLWEAWGWNSPLPTRRLCGEEKKPQRTPRKALKNKEKGSGGDFAYSNVLRGYKWIILCWQTQKIIAMPKLVQHLFHCGFAILVLVFGFFLTMDRKMAATITVATAIAATISMLVLLILGCDIICYWN